MFSRIGIIFYVSSVERENSRHHNKYYDGSVFSFQSYFRYCIFDSLSLFHYFFFYFGHVQNIFAQLFYVAHIKSKCILSGTIMWNGSTCVCVLVSAIKSINTSAEKFFWCKCKSCNWQTIAPLFRLNSIWVCWLHWLLKCIFHRFYHSGKFDGEIDIVVSTSGILVVLLWCFLRANFTDFSAKHSNIHFQNSKTTAIVCSNRVQF